MNRKEKLVGFLMANILILVGAVGVTYSIYLGAAIALIGISFHVEIILDILSPNQEEADPA